jgi:NAD(P)-dependent dehydrogenase (short-subunit alcohol dehydrogenase family)
MDRTWLITGSSSGFDRALAEAALAGGDRVGRVFCARVRALPLWSPAAAWLLVALSAL